MKSVGTRAACLESKSAGGRHRPHSKVTLGGNAATRNEPSESSKLRGDLKRAWQWGSEVAPHPPSRQTDKLLPLFPASPHLDD